MSGYYHTYLVLRAIILSYRTVSPRRNSIRTPDVKPPDLGSGIKACTGLNYFPYYKVYIPYVVPPSLTEISIQRALTFSDMAYETKKEKKWH